MKIYEYKWTVMTSAKKIKNIHDLFLDMITD